MKYKILTPKSPINSCTVTLFLYLKSKKRNQKLNPNPFQKIGQLKFKVNSYSGDNSSNPIQSNEDFYPLIIPTDETDLS